MLYEITKELRTELLYRKCPFPVEYGPGPVSTVAIARTWIHVERDRSANESWAPPANVMRNPRAVWRRPINGRIRIYANSTESGARTQDHERLVDQLADLVGCALYKIGKQRKMLAIDISGKMLSREDIDAESLQQWPGAIYEMSVVFSRSVLDKDFEGNGRPEGAFSSSETHSEVTILGFDSSTAEDACALHETVVFSDDVGVYTIIASAADFMTMGIVDGSIVGIAGSSLNDGLYTVLDVISSTQIQVAESVQNETAPYSDVTITIEGT
jgi:hypothetical protein